jgi:hypothetical protein
MAADGITNTKITSFWNENEQKTKLEGRTPQNIKEQIMNKL